MPSPMLSSNATKTERRVWLVIRPGSDGKPTLDVRFSEPDAHGALAVIRAMGTVADDAVLSLDVEGDAGANGWTPMLVAEADGTRTLVRVADWVRGATAEKPPVGYLTTSGLTATKADAFNFNAIKRVRAFSGVTNAQGIAAISFGGLFATVPQIIVQPAQPAVVVGGSKSELVAGSLTKDGCQVKVTGAALLSSTVVALVGATANLIAIET